MKNVIITDGSVRIRATLNDTLAARDFEKRLPFTCSGYDSGIDYCCSAANGLYDPLETQVPTQARGMCIGAEDGTILPRICEVPIVQRDRPTWQVTIWACVL